jgi:hypothetical protein
LGKVPIPVPDNGKYKFCKLYEKGNHLSPALFQRKKFFSFITLSDTSSHKLDVLLLLLLGGNFFSHKEYITWQDSPCEKSVYSHVFKINEFHF